MARASSARQWDALVQTLQPRFHVHAVELHGHGTQPRWAGVKPLRLADEVALAEPFLQATDAVHVVGHSYGAAVALKLATMYPDRVLSLVAYEPVLFRMLSDREPGGGDRSRAGCMGAFAIVARIPK